MSNEKGTTTTPHQVRGRFWQDNHSGRRRHKLITKELADNIPPLYANDGADDPDAVVARAKLFSPYTGWRWYITEWDAETGTCFGLVEGFETELGYFDLTELAEATVFGRVPAVERDLHWEPKTLGEIRGQSSRTGGLSKGQKRDMERRRPCLLRLERKTTRSDAPGADDSLSGDRADDTAPATVVEEGDSNDAADRWAGRQQGGRAGRTGFRRHCGEHDAPPEDLRIVVSIKAGTATIGVQQPSSDPHIETFDEGDLTGLTQETLAVVERARARWEDNPRHPAHVRPDPPARRRGRRGQGAAQDATGLAEESQAQQQTLRLF